MDAHVRTQMYTLVESKKGNGGLKFRIVQCKMFVLPSREHATREFPCIYSVGIFLLAYYAVIEL